MSDFPTLDTPLPTLLLDAERPWEWPQPPFARSHSMSPLDGGAQACRIETHTGSTVEGSLVHFDLEARLLRFCIDQGGEALTMPFGKFRRLTLTAAWPLAQRASVNGPVERVPTAAQERSYRIELMGGGTLDGQTMGHVRDRAGIFLFAPLDNGAAVQRVFVPQVAFMAIEFGKSAQEQAAERWISTPQQLLAALDAQKTARIKPLGDALVDLGLVTRGVLEQVASRLGAERPLGEELVAAGLLARADLQTALAHKMGYPLVDLSRFQIDPQSACKLSPRALREHNAFPLMQDGDRLIVAIDDLSHVPALQSLRSAAGLRVVPVLASRERIRLALAALPQQLGIDRWADNVPVDPKLSPLTAPGGLH